VNYRLRTTAQGDGSHVNSPRNVLLIFSVHQHTSPRYKPGLLPANVLIVVTNCNTSLEFRSEKNPVSEQARWPGDGVTQCHVRYAVPFPFHTCSSTRSVCTLGVCNTHGFILSLSDDTASSVDDHVTSQRMTGRVGKNSVGDFRGSLDNHLVKLNKIKKCHRIDKQITGQYSSALSVYVGGLKVVVSFSKCLVSYRTTLSALRVVWVQQQHSDW
jgi:hypothetical protein